MLTNVEVLYAWKRNSLTGCIVTAVKATERHYLELALPEILWVWFVVSASPSLVWLAASLYVNWDDITVQLQASCVEGTRVVSPTHTLLLPLPFHTQHVQPWVQAGVVHHVQGRDTVQPQPLPPQTVLLWGVLEEPSKLVCLRAGLRTRCV